MTTTTDPLALPNDVDYAAKLADAVAIMDGARDHYSITAQSSGPIVRIWAKDHRDAQDAVQAFQATPDATATSELTLVWVRHWNGEPSVEIVTARPASAVAGAA